MLNRALAEHHRQYLEKNTQVSYKLREHLAAGGVVDPRILMMYSIPNYRKLLEHIAQHGHIETVSLMIQLLLSNNVNFMGASSDDEYDSDDSGCQVQLYDDVETQFYIAAMYGHADIVKLIFERCKVDERVCRDACRAAMYHKRVDVVKLIVMKFDIGILDITILRFAIDNNDAELVNFTISKDIKLRNNANLFYAIGRKCSAEVMAVLTGK